MGNGKQLSGEETEIIITFLVNHICDGHLARGSFVAAAAEFNRPESTIRGLFHRWRHSYQDKHLSIQKVSKMSASAPKPGPKRKYNHKDLLHRMAQLPHKQRTSMRR